MAGAGDCKEFFVLRVWISFHHVRICVLAEIEGMSGIPVHDQHSGTDLLAVLKDRLIHKGHTAGHIPALIGVQSPGYLLTFEHLIDTSPGSGLVFRPLTPRLETNTYLIWKKYQVFTPIAEKLLAMVKDAFLRYSDQQP